MAEYRLYCLNDRGGFSKSYEIEASSDSDALAQAYAMKLGHSSELWSRNRRVAKLSPGDPKPS